MAGSTVEYVSGKKASIRFDSKLCIHGVSCVSPMYSKRMFKDHGLIRMLRYLTLYSKSRTTVLQARLRLNGLDGGETETPPKVNLISVRENGPLAFHADLKVGDQSVSYRAT